MCSCREGTVHPNSSQASKEAGVVKYTRHRWHILLTGKWLDASPNSSPDKGVSCCYYSYHYRGVYLSSHLSFCLSICSSYVSLWCAQLHPWSGCLWTFFLLLFRELSNQPQPSSSPTSLEAPQIPLRAPWSFSLQHFHNYTLKKYLSAKLKHWLQIKYGALYCQLWGSDKCRL